MPSYPPGLTTATISVGNVVDFYGDRAAVSAKVTPVLGTGVTHIVHAATGTVMVAASRTYESDITSGVATFDLPHTDAAGWTDPAGNTVTGWHYAVTVTATLNEGFGASQTWTKTVQPLVGQTAIDLDLVPSGEEFAPTVSAPIPVLSLNGQTGHVSFAGDAATNAALDAIRGGTAIYSTDSLDALTTPGFYYVTGAVTSWGAGWPPVTGQRPTVRVRLAGGNNLYLLQRVEYSGGRVYQRYRNNGTWEPWTEYQRAQDTGLRSVRDLFAGTPGGGPIMLRRANNVVNLNIYGVSFASVNQTLWTLPVGFRPDYHRVFAANSFTASGARFIVSSSAGTVQSIGNTDGATYYLTMTWLTNDAYPSTLPGTAA